MEKKKEVIKYDPPYLPTTAVDPIDPTVWVHHIGKLPDHVDETVMSDELHQSWILGADYDEHGSIFQYVVAQIQFAEEHTRLMLSNANMMRQKLKRIRQISAQRDIYFHDMRESLRRIQKISTDAFKWEDDYYNQPTTN